MDIQAPSSVLMVRPAAFGFNPETSESNAFQAFTGRKEYNELQPVALNEFDGLVHVLKEAGIQVIIMEDTPQPPKPDAVFPNNWISFHHDGTVILYPMLAKNRRTERRAETVYSLLANANYNVNNIIDISSYENEGKFLEGTGSIVFDYQGKTAYAVLSPRTDALLLNLLCNKLGFRALGFNAFDSSGKEIYHTNVVMTIGSGYAVICLDAIKDPGQQKLIARSLNDSGHELIRINMDQMYSFAGNMLELQGKNNRNILVMSERAYNSLEINQLEMIRKYATPVFSNLSTIESFSGGSARCMMAGIYLPGK